MPGRKLCERHSSNNPARYRPEPIASIDAASKLLVSARKSDRKKGMTMLSELRADEHMLRHALQESDSGVLEIASKALMYHPPELVYHLLTQPSSLAARFYFRYHIARGNHLYAEEAIRSVYSRRSKLPLMVIKSIGLSYLQTLSHSLLGYLNAPLELYDEMQRKDPREVEGVEGTDVAGWSRAGWAAIFSATALTRLDADLDLDEVNRLLEETRQTQATLQGRDLWVRERTQHSLLNCEARLRWILFDKQLQPDCDAVVGLIRDGAIDVLPDLATTLLKRNDQDRMTKIAREFQLVYFVREEFCYWPLMNWLECNEYLPREKFGACRRWDQRQPLSILASPRGR
jgi:hypothetical protein